MHVVSAHVNDGGKENKFLWVKWKFNLKRKYKDKKWNKIHTLSCGGWGKSKYVLCGYFGCFQFTTCVPLISIFYIAYTNFKSTFINFSTKRISIKPKVHSIIGMKNVYQGFSYIHVLNVVIDNRHDVSLDKLHQR